MSTTASSNSSRKEHQPTISSCVAKFESIQDGGWKNGQIKNALLYMIIKDDLPLCTSEKIGFLYFMKTVLPLYKVPGRTTITNMVDVKYEIFSRQVKERLKKALAVSLTTDVWTDILNTKSYLGVTCHFVDLTSKKLCCYVLAVKELQESHDAAYLGATLKTICTEWEIDEVICVTTDNASNMIKAVCDSFGEHKHMPCFAHTINLVANSPFHDQKGIADLKKIVCSVKEIVTFFKHSVSATDDLRKSQKDSSSPLKLIQSVVTRWNSTFYQLERFLKLSPKVAPILLNHSRAPPMVTSQQMRVIEDLINIYRPLEAFTKEVSGENYATSGVVIPLVNCLKKGIEKIIPNTAIGDLTQTILLNELQERFSSIEKKNSLAISTILDPRFKKIHFQNSLYCANGIMELKKLLSISESPQKSNINNSGFEDAEQNRSVWSYHNELVKLNCNNETVCESEKASELKQYLLKPVIDIKADIVSFWCDKKNESISNLWQIALRHLTIMSSSVPCERVFSLAGNVLTDKRNRLEKLDKILFLKSIAFDDWLLQ